MSPQISTKACLKYDSENVPYIDLGNGRVQLEKQEPDEKALEKARRELRELPEITEKAMKELKELIQNETHLHLPTDDECLRMFLRPCKYYPESAIKRVKQFYNLKIKYNLSFQEIMPCNVRHVFEHEVLHLMPKRDQNDCRILLLEAGKKWKPSKCSLADLFKAVQLTVLAAMAEPITQINGSIVIIDVEDLPLSHVMQFTPSFAAMVLEYVQDCLIMRLKGVHIVNNSYIFNMLFAIFKPFIKEKLRKRIFFHGKDRKSLTSHVSKECLPVKYGGTMDIDPVPGYILADLFECYKKDFEMANSFGFTKDLKNF